MASSGVCQTNEFAEKSVQLLTLEPVGVRLVREVRELQPRIGRPRQLQESSGGHAPERRILGRASVDVGLRLLAAARHGARQAVLEVQEGLRPARADRAAVQRLVLAQIPDNKKVLASLAHRIILPNITLPETLSWAG